MSASVARIGSNRQKYHDRIPNLVLGMSRKGMFPEEWCAELGISMRTLFVWANERAEFEDAVEAGWHILHAYWARLLRENITNPAFRQTAALQVMAKRFPATWGQTPRNTLEHFTSRNEPSPENDNGLCTNCTSIQDLTVKELKKELQLLRQRHFPNS